MSPFNLLRVPVACALLALSGCGGGGGGDSAPQTYTTQILSDSAYDGDIDQNGVVTQGMTPTVQQVFAGIDPVNGLEYRAFLDFPLGGSGGIPANARINAASLEVFIDDLIPNTAVVPVRVDLVSFQPPSLIPSDYDRTIQQAIAFTRLTPPLAGADIGKYVPIDVTGLMIEAQRRGLPDFQVRILEDLGGPAVYGRFVIDDSTGSNRSARAPLLTVTYF